MVSLTFNATAIAKGYSVAYQPPTYVVAGSTIAIPGLKSRVNMLLKSVSADKKTWTFDYKVFNTSGGETTASRISVWGFDIVPVTGLYKSGSITGAYTIAAVNTGSNIPILGTRNTCFKTGGNAGNCAGGGNGGVVQGATGIGTFAIVYSLAQTQAQLQHLFVRYQSVVNTTRALKGISADAAATDQAAVPEPASWAMLIGGFGLTGAAMRRRRREMSVTI